MSLMTRKILLMIRKVLSMIRNVDLVKALCDWVQRQGPTTRSSDWVDLADGIDQRGSFNDQKGRINEACSAEAWPAEAFCD
jgi:hypothetical protein